MSATTITSLLDQYRRHTGDDDTVEIIDAQQRQNDPQYCHHDDCTGNPDGGEAEYTIEGTPNCAAHTTAYLTLAIAPYRELEQLITQAGEQGLAVQLIDDGRLDTMRRCRSCQHHATYTVEREEYCLQHIVVLLKELL